METHADVPAYLRYLMRYGPHPWPSEKTKGMDAWALWRQVFVGQELITEEAVALFNFDSEGRSFNRFLKSDGVVKPA